MESVMNDETSNVEMVEILASIEKLTKDLKNASITLSEHEVRFLVDSYYEMQKDRIRSAHQERTLAKSEEPHSILTWLTSQRGTLEKQIARALDVYSNGQPAGAWARSITGIGPIIASGLIANINIEKAPTVGHIWNYAGLNPTITWNKGEKRPWNGSLKRLCWIIGESFVKVSYLESDVYGKMYLKRKEYEAIKNDAGEYAEQAANALKVKKFRDDTKAKEFYLKGLLPPGHLHSRAKRYAVKIFLSHLHYVMFELKYNMRPPKPFVIEHMGHVHEILPPNWPIKP
jgi:hypothetical protein